MINIHILPTKKLSRLQLQMNGNFHIENGQTVSLRSYQNIYITSDEDIKEGDWCILLKGKKDYIFKALPIDNYSNCKKIILTTDQDLIKDGVQAIDNEFLEWFVKNPNCEYSIIDKEEDFYKVFIPSIDIEDEIIISKEEFKTECYCEKTLWCDCKPKQEPVLKCDLCNTYPRLEGTNKCESCYSVVRHFLEQDPRFKDTLLPDLRNKEETLEEVAEKTADNFEEPNFKAGVIYGVIEGAKWQAERMYTQEEVLNHLNNLMKIPNSHLDKFTDEQGNITKDWFE